MLVAKRSALLGDSTAPNNPFSDVILYMMKENKKEERWRRRKKERRRRKRKKGEEERTYLDLRFGCRR
jgi:hypothetical protein